MQKILIFGIEMSVKTENNKKLIFGNKKKSRSFPRNWNYQGLYKLESLYRIINVNHLPTKRSKLNFHLIDWL